MTLMDFLDVQKSGLWVTLGQRKPVACWPGVVFGMPFEIEFVSLENRFLLCVTLNLEILDMEEQVCMGRPMSAEK
jgi:hypothetical protein